jgi:AraC family transcriptional regulator
MTQDTLDERLAAVHRAVRRIRADIGAEHSLSDLARAALLSPFHFHRIFHQLTDCTPGRYLAAVRMAEAKRQLVFSSANVTDICMDVGYSSLGTFTSQFTRLGVCPRRFRAVAQGFADQSFNSLLVQLQPDLPRPERVQLTATLGTGPGPGSVAVVGLFPSGIPQGFPHACAIGELPGAVEFGDLPDGEYHPLAMSFHASVTVADAMVDEEPVGCFVGSCGTAVHLVEGRCTPTSSVHIELRPRRGSDPPLLLALPLLKAAELSYSCGAFECARSRIALP